MSYTLYSEDEVEELDLLQVSDPRSPYGSDSDGSSAADSEDEVDGLEGLRVGVLTPSELSKKVRDFYFKDDGFRISTKIIDSRYHVRDFSRVRAPKDLLDRFRKLAASLPMHADPIGDGLDNVRAIICWTARLKSQKPQCVRLAEMVVSLWEDVMAHPKLSKEYDVPGTSAYILLCLLRASLKGYRQRQFAHATSSLVTRSRRRGSFLTDMAKLAKELRKIVSECRKKFGMVHKIHNIAAGPPVLENRSLMTVPVVTQALKEAVAKGLNRFRVDHLWISLGSQYPKVSQLAPLFTFLRLINLDIVKKKASSRKRKHGDEDGIGTQDPAASDTSHSESLIRKLRYETHVSWFAFRDVIHLTKWKDTVRRRMSAWFRRINTIEKTMAGPDIHLTLHLLLILFAKLDFMSEAAVIAEMLVVVYREASEREPTSKTMKINLASALGALSVSTYHAGRHLEAVRAAEDGIQILMPLLNKRRSLCLAPLGGLQTAYATALLCLSGINNGEGNSSKAQKLFLGYRSCVVAEHAVNTLRALTTAQPTYVTGRELLARAIRSLLEATIVILDRFHACQGQHPSTTLNNFKWTKVPACCGRITLQEALLVHNCIEDPPSARLSQHFKSAGEMVHIYRDIIAATPNAYEPFLTDTLHWKARLPGATAQESLRDYDEARQIYTRLMVAWPDHFNRKAARVYAGYALQLRCTGQYDKAAEAMSTAVEYQLSDSQQQIDKSSWRGMNIVASLASCHAFLLSQVGRYAEAFDEAQRAETVFRAATKVTEPMAKLCLAEPVAIKGYAEWMLGRPDDALKTLRQSLKLVRDSQPVSRGSEKDKERRTLRYCAKAPIYLLILGWMAGVAVSLGDRTAAQRDIDTAIMHARTLASGTRRRWGIEKNLEPIDHVIPHLLVISAGIMLESERMDEALEHVDEALEMSEGGAKCGPETYKTALLLKAGILEATEQPMEAAKYALQADMLPGTGFVDSLQCCTLIDQDTVWGCREH
ncbi:unnamed protein product [Tilletia controversa]|uniref:Anaphase-promoting complex subunit 5 n=1 Tax=Tilletia controversa TaxID=13291 RepID=A0A8X7SZQ9_9BASI|nr:hypothetical protein CF328_g1491 [Tilletia controversa]KAE8253393.1 hypothetical protein A4X06_0g1492 [Tilletia controversa]CAD6905968.1 unnamed protein product [Tilletia controversa]CAD6948672.1 unnamed protein product [Tilletia controversa]CAD6961039.1 unnamed protein product [Tilletia controversa]